MRNPLSVEMDRSKCRLAQIPNHQEAIVFAPLLLFLSGCYLDAGQTCKAKQALLLCIAAMELTIDSSSFCECPLIGIIYSQTIQELISCYEEATDESDSSLRGREIVQHALQYKVKIAIPWTNMWQRPGFIHPFPSKGVSVYDREYHPTWCKALERSWKEIRDELSCLIHRPCYTSAASNTRTAATGGGTHHNSDASLSIPSHWPVVGSASHRGGAGAHDGSVVADGGDWREIVLAGAGARPDLAPRTYQILQTHCSDALSLANAGGGEVIFSVLAPGTHIRPHCGSTNLRLTAHLGLVVPNSGECRIRIADRWVHWEEGKVIVFDDSFEHEVINFTSTLRVVLLLRFWHVDLPAPDRQRAVELALLAKQHDQRRRFNPPLPDWMDAFRSTKPDLSLRKKHDAIRNRGLEESRCSECWRTGFESIRLDESSRIFRCPCGSPIV